MGFMAGFGSAFSESFSESRKMSAIAEQDMFDKQFDSFMKNKEKYEEWEREDSRLVGMAKSAVQDTVLHLKLLVSLSNG